MREIVEGDQPIIAGYIVVATHGYARCSAQDRGVGGLSEELMSPRTLAEISRLPVPAKAPSPAGMDARWFKARLAPRPPT